MRAEDAVFVAADPDTLRTPMGSGIVAFRNRADAEVARTQHAGRILNLAELLAERKAALVDARENR